jgi:S-adenosylmethionine:tRNA-ribosyltransferase-isomerase (queuine synthetase)
MVSSKMLGNQTSRGEIMKSKEMYETAQEYLIENIGNQVSAGDVYYDNSTKTWNVKIISKTHHGILIVGEMHLDDEKTIVYITPGERMLKILRSKLKEERVLIDVPANALARIKETVPDVTVYG